MGALLPGRSDLQSPSRLRLPAKAQRQMTKDGFLMYLLSADGSAFDLAHRRVYQDMDQPLSHYLVSSSHNTYLLEDQLTGPAAQKPTSGGAGQLGRDGAWRGVAGRGRA